MIYLKLWENFNSDTNRFEQENMNDKEIKNYTIEELKPIEDWIKSFWDRIESYQEDKLFNIFKQIEDNLGEDVAQIIDGMYSADKLHYHQSGKTSFTGGIDTGHFIEKFDIIS